MINDNYDTMPPEKSLRQRAEGLVGTPLVDYAGITQDEIKSLVHELNIHRAELQVQNEELREAQIELADSRDRFNNLYEFAPVGCATLDCHGVIEEANLTAVGMLGVDRSTLIGRKLSDFVADSSQGDWHIHCREILSGEAPKSCELDIKPTDKPGLNLQVFSRATPDEDGQMRHFHVALGDVTGQICA